MLDINVNEKDGKLSVNIEDFNGNRITISDDLSYQDSHDLTTVLEVAVDEIETFFSDKKEVKS